MMRVLLAVVASLFLSACSPYFTKPNESNAAAGIATSCVVAAAAIDVLTAASNLGELSYEQQQAVLESISVISPICLAETPPTLDDVRRAAFLQAIEYLSQKAQEQ